jgi:two-component system copper resistance phosphate regulon response regulator CusR
VFSLSRPTKKTVQFLNKGLKENIFAMDNAGNGTKGLAIGEVADYSLILMEVNLPGMAGWEVLRNLFRSIPHS